MLRIQAWWRKRQLVNSILKASGGSKSVRPRLNAKERELMARLLLAEVTYVLDHTKKSQEEREKQVEIAFDTYRSVRDKRVPPQLVRSKGKDGRLVWERQRVGIPIVPQFLMHLFLNRVDRHAIRGDLDEEFQQIIIPKFGRQRAYLWYWTQAISIVAYRNPLSRCICGGIGVWKVVEWISRKVGS